MCLGPAAVAVAYVARNAEQLTHNVICRGRILFFFLCRKEHRGEARCKSHAGHDDDDSDFGPIPSLQRCWRVLRDTFNVSQLALTGSGRDRDRDRRREIVLKENAPPLPRPSMTCDWNI